MSVLKPLHIIKQKNKLPSASVIFLHGSGDNGYGVFKWIEFLIGKLESPHLRFLFPSAPLQPYTAYDGERSNVWFDRIEVDIGVAEQTASIERISHDVKTLVNNEVALGIPLNRILIGGFSMGGSMSLHVAYRYIPGLAGVYTLSSFLNRDSAIYKIPKLPDIPLYMCHGDRDSLVPLEWGKETYKALVELGAKGEFTRIKNAFHELKRDELKSLLEWINKILPPLPSDSS